MVKIEPITLPTFGHAEVLPQLSLDEYRARLTAAVARMQQAGLDALVVYADREHFANIAYLTGFEPRFEEALLLLDATGKRLLVVGNECMGYLPDAALGYEVALFQDFSLPGQPRGSSQPLRQILAGFGIARGMRVGCAGWKAYTPALMGEPAYALDAPSYLVDLLRALTGADRSVINVAGFFNDPQDGLRIINSADQLAQFEFAATRTSDSMLAAMQQIRPGLAEYELERHLQGDGLPLSAHRNIGFGDKVRRGLASASDKRARLGEAYAIGFGLWGSLTCRAGAVAHGPQDLPEALRAFYPDLAANYFAVYSTWYEQLKLGTTAGQVYAAVEAQRDPALYDLAVNPGHYIHLDEWVHSPFAPGSPVQLRSGMALQMDIIPVSRGPYCFINAEDTLALADEGLRAEVSQKHPACWQRIQARRQFMIAQLGINLDACVLPLGNMPGWLPPYVLALDMALVKR